MSVVANCYSSVLNNRIHFFLEETNAKVNEQNGFRKDRSCVDHVFTLNSLIQNRTSYFATFVDLRKAFDSVVSNLLQYKLQPNGIDGCMYNAIASHYKDTESCVYINGYLTNWFNCADGVWQGDNLLPTLFSIFINDLATEVREPNKGVQMIN